MGSGGILRGLSENRVRRGGYNQLCGLEGEYENAKL